jgi:hypothetical protein
LTDELHDLLDACSGATHDPRCAQRLQRHLLAVLLSPEEATVTNLIRLSGTPHQDWTADYRLYSHDRVDETHLFGVAFQELLRTLPEDQPVVTALDDTLTRKTGPHIHGVAWRRDPLGPHFQTNLVRGQRYLQLSVAWPLEDGAARMVPVAFQHAPSAPKPPRDATAEQLDAHREMKRQMSLNAYALERMRALRAACPAARRIVFCGDGGYTNAAVVTHLPENTLYIGRIRKDADLYQPPPSDATIPPVGRPRLYGDKALTPEQLRQDDTQAWQTVSAFASGKVHSFRVKTMAPVLWRKAGGEQRFRVMVIAPVGYRLRKGSKLLYRQPAYLICTDENLPIGALLQYYLWRWGIEVNFREEKTLLGVGEAQVRTAPSNQHLPGAIVAAYALLWVACLRMRKAGRWPSRLKPPRWDQRPPNQNALPSTGDLLRTLRFEEWARSVCPRPFCHFASPPLPTTKPPKTQNHPQEALKTAV